MYLGSKAGIRIIQMHLAGLGKFSKLCMGKHNRIQFECYCREVAVRPGIYNIEFQQENKKEKLCLS